MKKSRLLLLMLSAALIISIFAGCTKNDGQSPNNSAIESVPPTIQELHAAIAQAYGEDYPPNGEIPPEVLETEFGLTPALYDEAEGKMPMVSVQNDRVVIAKAADGKADELEATLVAARQDKIDNMMEYPQNIAKTHAAQVVRQGDYVAFLLIGLPNDELAANDQESRRYAEEQVQIAVDAFYGAFNPT